MFTVIAVERVPDHLRGFVSRHLFEIATGVYVGKVTRRMADRLWERMVTNFDCGAVIQVMSYPGGPGYQIRQAGDPRRAVRDFDGLHIPVTVERPETQNP
jgi:CRISPR-associated protein Cas2